MRTRVAVLILLIAAVLTNTSCRSRKKPVTPQAAPPVAESPAPPPETPVQADRDFVQPRAEPDVLSADLAEANRVARERGWISDAFFAFDASTLDAQAREALERTATWLRDHPEFRIRVEGHCDDRGTEQYNLALGDRRAETAAAYLATLGVERSRIETTSYGEERPFEQGENETAWAQNRRAHIVLAGRR